MIDHGHTGDGDAAGEGMTGENLNQRVIHCTFRQQSVMCVCVVCSRVYGLCVCVCACVCTFEVASAID